MNYRELFARGDKVEVATNREFTDIMFGEILTVADNGINVRYTNEEEWGILRFCWHEDDPRMQELGKFEASVSRMTNDDTGVVNTGVFRLSRTQQVLNEMPTALRAINEKVDAMDGTIERLAHQVAALAAQVKADKKAPAKRGKKPELETVGASE